MILFLSFELFLLFLFFLLFLLFLSFELFLLFLSFELFLLFLSYLPLRKRGIEGDLNLCPIRLSLSHKSADPLLMLFIVGIGVRVLGHFSLR
jgi:hypothetical protein